MTERDILLAFAERYPRSAMRTGGRPLRLRDWETRDPAITRSAEAFSIFLDSMEALERRGILRLGWHRRGKGEKLEWAELLDPAALYQFLDRPSPDALALTLRRTAEKLAARVDTRGGALFRLVAVQPEPFIDLAGERELEDIDRILSLPPEASVGVPIRALSLRLFGDSKRLERLLPLIRKIVALGKRQDLLANLPIRAYPEVWIGGPLEIAFRNRPPWNLGTAPVGLTLALLREIEGLRILSVKNLDAPGMGRILSVENKETFYALCSSNLGFDAYVYCAGRPNRAVRLALRLLAAQGYRIFHAGDMDADGIAILAELNGLCGALPFGMNVETFNRYLPYGRDLSGPLLRRVVQLPVETRSLPGIAELIERITASRRAVEQEIIDYTLEPPPA